MPNNDQNPVIELPAHALAAIAVLEDAGFEAWVVGGFVRDALLGRTPGDVDMASSASWDEAARIFEDHGYAVHETGTKHGTITAIVKGEPIEITTFRSEGAYTDFRHPDDVTFVNTIEEDLGRRDFTINAMAYHPERGLVDPYRGARDLRRRVIRCVGDPQERFREDALRILRAIRFVSSTGFAMDDATGAAANELASLLSHLAVERLRRELDKLLCGDYVHNALMAHADVLFVLLPELRPMKGFEQHNRYHPYDVWEHTAYVVQNSRPHPMNRWAALLHDSGKPDTFYRDERGVGHMPGHPAASVKHLRSIAARMRFSSRLTERLALLIIHHDDRPAATKADVRRLYARLDGDDDLFHRLCDLMRADSLSKAQFTRLEGVIATNAVEQLFDRMKEEREAFGIADIPVNGRDIMELGIAQGPQVGRILDQLLDEVLEGTLRCTRAVLLARAREIAEGGGGNDLS